MARQTNTTRKETPLAPRPVEAAWGPAFAEPQAWALQWDGYALQGNNSRSATSATPARPNNSRSAR